MPPLKGAQVEQKIKPREARSQDLGWVTKRFFVSGGGEPPRLAAKAEDQRAHLGVDRRPARLAVRIRPPASDESTMRVQERLCSVEPSAAPLGQSACGGFLERFATRRAELAAFVATVLEGGKSL